MRYHEPFLGAASMFLSIRPGDSVLSDLNSDLIGSFRAVQSSPRLVARYLADHKKRHSREYYYSIRELYNSKRGSKSVAQGTRFIYLNRACFNGVFRVNKRGEFNVPCGEPERTLFPDFVHLDFVGQALKSASLQVSDFRHSLSTIGAGDFAYLDPPYPPLNGTSFFRHYTAGRFQEEDQICLADTIEKIHERGALFMLSNADTELIRNLYSKYHVYHLDTVRWITSKSTKVQVRELVITNYTPHSQLEDDRGGLDGDS